MITQFEKQLNPDEYDYVFTSGIHFQIHQNYLIQEKILNSSNIDEYKSYRQLNDSNAILEKITLLNNNLQFESNIEKRKIIIQKANLKIDKNHVLFEKILNPKISKDDWVLNAKFFNKIALIILHWDLSHSKEEDLVNDLSKIISNSYYKNIGQPIILENIFYECSTSKLKSAILLAEKISKIEQLIQEKNNSFAN